MPELSVLMPVRDGARWLEEAVGSVLAQNFRDFELIVVDDGSSDATPSLLADFAARDSRIVVIRQPPSGVVAALNAGLAAARAPLVARLDADDVAEPERFAEQIDTLRRDPMLVLLGSWAKDIDANGRITGMRRPETDPDDLERRLETGNPMIHPSVMFRTAAARAVGGYRIAFAAAEDFDLWLRLLVHGRIANLPRELIRYRVHHESITAKQPLQQMFATRLALRSAELRRDGATDPLIDYGKPFSVHSDSPPAYADIVRLYRILTWTGDDPDEAGVMLPLDVLRRPDLSRRERSLAQQAIARIIAANRATAPAALWWHLCALRPARAVPLLWRLATTPGARRAT